MYFSMPQASLTKRALAVLVLMLLSVGCQRNAPREVIFNEKGPTMIELYRNQTARARDVQQQVGYSSGENQGYTRDASSELDMLFPKLDNPRLVMYVFAHLSENGHPVPGYSTAFYLYESSQVFALPGEVQP